LIEAQSIYLPPANMFDPSINSLLSPAEFTLGSRVLTFAPNTTPNPFLGVNEIKVKVTHNSAFDPPYEICQQTTQNSPSLGNGWYACTFTKDEDGSDLLKAEWAYNKNPTDGATAYDIVLVRQVAAVEHPTHLFDNPYANIAADVVTPSGPSNPVKITPDDAAEIQQLVLGIIPSFTQSPSWRFVPVGHLYLDLNFQNQFLNNPFATSFPYPYPNYLGSYNRIISLPSEYEPAPLGLLGGAIAVKMGDVNFSNVSANSFSGLPIERSSQIFVSSPKSLKKGALLKISCLLQDSLQDLVAWQASLGYDDTKLNIVNIASKGLHHFGKENYSILSQELRTLWTSASLKPIYAPKGLLLFDVVIELQQDVLADEPLLVWGRGLETAFYRPDGNRLSSNIDSEIEILFEPISLFTLPNPFDESLLIRVKSGQSNSGDTQLLLLTSDGREVARTTLPLGQDEVSISCAHIPKGIYFLKSINGLQVVSTAVFKH
jgi:hypothetical protein